MNADSNKNESLSNETSNQFRALKLLSYGGAETIQLVSVEALKGPTDGQVLVRVHAAGVNGLDWKIREGYVREVFPLELPATLGLEIAGVVVSVGGGVDRFQEGDRVMGWLGTIGGYADQVIASADNLGHIPEGMGFVEAAGLPTVVQAASQSLQAGGPIGEGSRVLIHGAAGAVGAFAVQIARQAGATIFASARGRYAEYVRELGASEVIDYETERFEDRAHNIDLVLDLVGGETLDRSWSVLSPNGMIVTTAAPDIAAKAPAGKKGVFLMTKADPAQVEKTARDIVEGRVSQKIESVVSLEEAPQAIERNRTQPHLGKTVVALIPA
ncbi:MAG: NADP-dependent oxidoreductase [Capsulimonas sp.]|uniref:NADP-dependent oxidoreductase n=1 Tax=Capsulimonas sp. TaxID=2494211 RepID=UPI003263AAF3